jgi:hypothetical protein
MKKTKMFLGVFAASLLSIAGISGASAQSISAQFTITNSYGSTIFLDSASCTSGSIFAPSSIANNNTQSFSGTTTSGSTLCTVRYHSGSFGCQFVVEATNFGTGFGNSNAYEGSGSGPHCTTQPYTPTTGNQAVPFKMTP